MNIGVLALQGAFREHRQMLESLGCKVTEVRLPKQLDGLAGVVFPGGESTTIGKLMVHYGFISALPKYFTDGGAIWGTCAGAILLADEIVYSKQNNSKTIVSDQPRLGLLPMRVHRNAYGRQVDSFERDLSIVGLDSPFHAVFIRAPSIENIGKGVDVMAQMDERIVAVKKGKLMASSFHPELTRDTRLHKYFLENIVGA